MLVHPTHSIDMLDGGENVPVGFDENFKFTSATAALPENSRVLVVSDGIVEQFSPDGPRCAIRPGSC